MRESRKRAIALMVRRQIIYAIKEDLDGGECLMKEVFENMMDDDEQEFCYAEMRKIIGEITDGIP